ncbi:hypothetical protein HHI36_014176 [Cryptolaemus montrouzieri]|uniref:EGF-like domain-containing protein n=1 Tax=Cryptolaemus montrouzieri TaxID=559131 RepID=A0ABD2N244_9CUCU
MIPLVIWLLFTISIEGSLVNINEVAKPCIEDSNCPQNRSCKLGFCKNPCLEVCNSEAICVVVKHKPYCFCKEDNDDCIPEKISCVPQCEKNSVCNTDIGYCECKSGYQGNPYRGCSKKCTSDSNCHSDETCINGKCRSPCEEDCGVNSICEVADHTSLCDCLPGFAGNAFEMCWPIRMAFLLTRDKICQQCGINAECNTINGRTFCHCQKGFRGNPYLSCQKMCKTNSDCPADRICGDQLCRDPCEEACGVNTICEVQNRKPKCSCQKGFSGDPTRICTMSLGNRFADSEEELDCHPKCGDNATCDTEHGICVCKLNFFGNPYGGCRKKCGMDSDCSKDEACIENDCKNPCLEACGKNALCAVNNHEPICSCPRGFSGDPLKICRENVVTQPTIVEVDLCDTLKCGAKAECKIEETEICKCLPGYHGNPYIGCFKKCATNLECTNEDLCSNGTCENACKNSCGINAICKADKHKPQCSCPAKYKGDPHKICFPNKEGVLSNPSKVPCLKCICRAITGKMISSLVHESQSASDTGHSQEKTWLEGRTLEQGTQQ